MAYLIRSRRGKFALYHKGIYITSSADPYALMGIVALGTQCGDRQ